jgi:antitoxin component YwqK of YwqJK toxin-antitoxin module
MLKIIPGFFLTFLIILPVLLYAQTQTYTGKIVDKETNKGIKDVLIKLSNSDVQCLTNALGYFQISADTSSFFLISSSGYEPVFVKAPSTDAFQVALQSATKTGYITTDTPKETKVVFKESFRGFEEYSVLKNKVDKKHGSYIRYYYTLKGIELIESGNYEEGEKHGLYDYFHTFFKEASHNAMFANLGKPLNCIKERGYYVKGKKEGEWSYYYLDTISDVKEVHRMVNKGRIDSIKVLFEPKADLLKQVGIYNNGIKTGRWTTYDREMKISQVYDYTNQRLVFDKSVSDTLEINKNRKAIFLGNEELLKDSLLQRIDLKALDFRLEKGVTSVSLDFTVDASGRVSNLRVAGGNGFKMMHNALMKAVSLTSNQWIPALKDGVPVDCEKKLLFEIHRTYIKNNHYKQIVSLGLTN